MRLVPIIRGAGVSTCSGSESTEPPGTAFLHDICTTGKVAATRVGTRRSFAHALQQICAESFFSFGERYSIRRSCSRTDIGGGGGAGAR